MRSNQKRLRRFGRDLTGTREKYRNNWSTGADLEFFGVVATLGPLNVRAAGRVGEKAGTEVEGETGDASGGFDVVIAIAEGVAGGRVDFEEPAQMVSSVSVLIRGGPEGGSCSLGECLGAQGAVNVGGLEGGSHEGAVRFADGALADDTSGRADGADGGLQGVLGLGGHAIAQLGHDGRRQRLAKVL